MMKLSRLLNFLGFKKMADRLALRALARSFRKTAKILDGLYLSSIDAGIAFSALAETLKRKPA